MTPMYPLTGTPTAQPFGAGGLPENLVRSSAAKVGSMPSLVVSVAVIRFPGRYLGCREDFAGLLRSIRMTSATPGPVSAAGSAAAPTGRIPTGVTPNLYPGMPGWLPSSSGVPLPDPAMVDGKPVGLWWRAAGALGTADVRVYLPHGVRASNPRLGGPRLYDLEGQRRQPGAKGVGTFDIGGGQIVERYDGFENRYGYAATRDSFQVGGATFRPLLPVTGRSIVGSWRGPRLNFDFREDGTVVYGTDVIPKRGRYELDGYLLQILPTGHIPRRFDI